MISGTHRYPLHEMARLLLGFSPKSRRAGSCMKSDVAFQLENAAWPAFVVEAGGNTRLLAIRQLWAETREPRFHKLGVLFRPWRSESHVLTAHLIENEQRIGQGIRNLKRALTKLG